MVYILQKLEIVILLHLLEVVSAYELVVGKVKFR